MRNIFHLRLQDIELQAERTIDRTLQTKPIAIISSHHDNGSVIALSSEAKEEGLFNGIKIHIARKMSHSVRMLPYNQNLYRQVHESLYQTIRNYTPLFEPELFGQYYMDMTGTSGLLGCMNDVGMHITRDIKNQLNLKSKIGISSNKLVSKISTEVVPETVWEIKNGNEPNFIAPLSPTFLPIYKEAFIKKVIRFLMLKSISQVQDILKIPQLAPIIFGRYYSHLSMQAFGRDISLVHPLLEKIKITEQKVLSQDTNDYQLLQRIVRELSGYIGFKMRSSHRLAKYIYIEIHYTDGFLNKKRSKLNSNDDHAIINICTSLLKKVFTRRNRVRSLIVTATDLFPASKQLYLFNQKETKQNSISSALDKIRLKFGEHRIHNGFSSKNYH